MSKLDEALNMKPVPSAPQKQQGLSLNEMLNTAKTKTTPNPTPAPLANSQSQLEVAAISALNVSIVSNVTDFPQRGDNPADSNNSNLAVELRRLLQLVREKLPTSEIALAMTDCLRFIQDNPATKDLLLPADIGLMTESLKSAYGIVLTQKTERSSKKTERKQEVEKLVADLGDMGFGKSLI